MSGRKPDGSVKGLRAKLLPPPRPLGVPKGLLLLLGAEGEDDEEGPKGLTGVLFAKSAGVSSR
mgnify:CR=1 FL=1